MKHQKPKTCLRGSFQVEGRSKKTKALYICDKKLLPRLRQYVSGFDKGRKPSLDQVVDYLQEKYGEYGRKKKNAFRISVQKVYQTIRSESAEEKKLQELEEKFLGKRKHSMDYLPFDIEEDSEAGLIISTDSECTEDEMRVDFQDGNLVNESMYKMYKTLNSRKNSEEENEEIFAMNTEQKSDMLPKPLVSEEKVNQVMEDITSTDADILKKRNVSENTDISKIKCNSILKANNITRNNNNSNINDKRTADNGFRNYNTTENINKRIQKSSSTKDKKRQMSQDTKRKNGKDSLREDTDASPSVPSLRFSDVGGCGECIQEVCKLLVHVKHPEVFKALGITPPKGFLLHGPPGCGKTLLAHAVAGELDIPLIKVASTEMVSGVSGESEGKIRDLFTRASAHAPCVLFLDEIDAITPKRETASKEMERRIVAQLLSCLDELSRSQEAQVVVIGATNRPDYLDPALRRAGRFDKEIRMGIPDERAREQILQVQCEDLKLSSEFDFKSVAQLTPGFVGADLMALVREAAMCAVTRIFHRLENEERTSNIFSTDPMTNTDNPEESDGRFDTSIMTWLKSSQIRFSEEQLQNLCIEKQDFTKALQDVQPSAKREGFATIPDVTWEDIGALENIREELTMAIIAPVRHREAFSELGLTNPPGILLAGPPGCGKTLLAKAIANESGINFISVKGPELLNMYVGESERAVRQVFQRARNSVPCVIFFDELDALCPRRSENAESNASARVVNQLLTEMDGLETRKQVFIMGATNRPDIIDPAILRPGRLDKVLYVGLPKEADRLAILQTITKRGKKPRLLADVDLTAIAADERCRRFSGADLAALVREASVNSLRECMKEAMKDPGEARELPVTNQDKPEEGPRHVGVAMRHFDLAFRKIKPSVSEQDQNIYRFMEERLTKEKPPC